MPQKKGSQETKVTDGICTITTKSWKDFYDYISDMNMSDYKNYIWRGHRCDNWLLESTFDRFLRKKKNAGKNRKDLLKDVLELFKDAIRGRRGSNPLEFKDDNSIWALGRHYGLYTPLLDWVTSVFVAAYFAFIIEGGEDQTGNRVIYALDKTSVDRKSTEIKGKEKGKPSIIEFHRPLSDENARLINQRGLFTLATDGVDIEKWVQTQFKGEQGVKVLMKFMIPNNERLHCLRSLNRMNINHLTLFPDIEGASKYCNVNFEIHQY